MSSFSRMQKYALFGLSAAGGVAFYFYTSQQNSKRQVLTSWTTNHQPSPFAKWDANWDHRQPTSCLKPVPDNASPEAQNRYNEKLMQHQPTAVRHIFLVRHGQYNLDGKVDEERILTQIGQQQAQYTGQRLKELDLPWNLLVKSTMTRAQQTGEIILRVLGDKKPEVENCSLLEEGAPIPPEPRVGHWKPEASFYQDGARIEAAFRKYFHRADPSQIGDSYTILVCHANVIRYFVCRALQFPAEAWLRISLHHASITWISIQPSGRVVLRTLGESGHIPPMHITSR